MTNLDRNFTFTYFRSCTDSVGTPLKATWGDWIEALTEHDIRDTKDGPALCFADLEDGKRNKENVKSIQALFIDIDKPVDVQALLEKLAPFEWVFYTTFSSSPGLIKFRVVLPLESPHGPDRHKDLWQRLNQLVDGFMDANTKATCNLSYLPASPSNDWAISYHNEGDFLSAEDLPELPEAEAPIERLDLEKLKDSIRRLERNPVVKKAWEKVFAGEAFAEEGERHDTVLKLTFSLANKTRKLNASNLADIFSPSLDDMANQEQPPTIDEIVRAYEGAVYKIEADNDIEAEYTQEELERIAKANGWEVRDLKRRWILQKEGYSYFLTESGEYHGPYAPQDRELGVRVKLARAPINLWTVSASGALRRRKYEEIALEHASLIEEVSKDLTLQRTTYDPKESVLTEAPCPIRTTLKPVFNEDIDTWIKKLGGRHYRKLIDWMAHASDLNVPLCAIYFHGPRRCGKTLFAHGISSLWTSGAPTAITALTSNFNEELFKCPLMFADEEFPSAFGKDALAALREAVGSPSRQINAKFKTPVSTKGYIRILLAANNNNILRSSKETTSDDHDAIAERILYIKISKDAVDFLDNLPKSTKDMWQSRGIAEHCLWLKENHKMAEPVRRFYVEGDLEEMIGNLQNSNELTSLVCEWLVRYCLNPKLFNSLETDLLDRSDRMLKVNVQALKDHWNLYLGEGEKRLTTKSIAIALRSLAKGEPERYRVGKRRLSYYSIPLRILTGWAEYNGVGDPEQIEEFLS